MVYWTPFLLYIEHPSMVNWTHYAWYIEPLPMIYRTSYPWYIEPHIMVFWSPYPWYIESLPQDILTPLPMVYRNPSFGRNKGIQYTMIGFNIQWPKICLPVQNTIWYIEPVVDFLGVQNNGFWWCSCCSCKFFV
jgi:hypothetical protein